LQREHTQHEEKFANLQKQKTGDSQPAMASKDPFQEGAEGTRERRNSEDSQLSHRSGDGEDDPSKWVNDVIRERSKSGGLQKG